ncbi:NACHT domain-containing protein [Pseudomonas marginalis]|uniref:NACHT domain-containing protein n=1 Tax=Pseudomonas marginalis TaxID=298 RepID=UPI00386500AE
MIIEFTVPMLTKVVTPIVTVIAKDLVGVVKENVLKLEVPRSSAMIANLIVNINTVKTIWSKDKALLLDEFYYEPRIFGKSYVGNSVARDLLKQNSVVEGIVGQGKSMLMRKLCNSVIEIGCIPIFLELRMLSKERSLTDLILDYLDACSIKGGLSVFQHLAHSGNIILLLDGFDEIHSDMVTSTVYQIEQFRKKYPKLRQVVSARPNNAIAHLTGFKTFSIAPLVQQDYEPFLKKLVKDVVFRTSLNIAIDEAPQSIKGVITTPLMLTLLCLVYENESEIPSSLPDFFDGLFNAVFTKHDKFKVGFYREQFSGLSESKIRKLFDSFCFMTLQSGFNRSLTGSQFEKVFQLASKFVPGVVCDIDGFKKDIVNVACLMLEDGFDELVFLHKSILEYHAAVFIKNSSDEICLRFYEKAPYNVLGWLEVFVFLSHIDSYRFSEHFVIKYYSVELEVLARLLSDKDVESLIDYVSVRVPNYEVRMNNSSPVSFSTHNTGFDLPFYHDLFNVLMHVTGESLSDAHPKKLQQAIRQTPAQIKGQVSISFASIARNLDISDLWTALRSLEGDLMEKVAQAKLIIDSEKMKHEIFN